MISSFGKKLADAGKTARADEWWDNKFCPVLGVAYATAYQLDLSLSRLWPVLGFLLVSPLAVGAYANLLNDLCDLRVDRFGKKRNRLENRSAIFRASALMAVIVLGGLTAAALWSSPILLGIYLAIWLAWTLYSLPPFRFKTRGFMGNLADAAGAHMLPQLFGIYLVANWGRHTAPDPAWVAAVAVWSLARGVRGILWHQLTDQASDQRAGVITFTQRHSLEFVRRLGGFVFFPLELAGLGAMLVLSGTVLAWALLVLYLLVETARCRHWNASPVVVIPRQGGFRFVLDEYYVLFYPLAFLLASSWRNASDLWVLGAHVLLFPFPIKCVARDTYSMIRGALGPNPRDTAS